MKTLLSEPLGYAEHAADIIDAAVARTEAGQRFALVTSLSIEGGAAREAGTLAMVDETGTMIGYLSNGCIDRDIQHHALSALSTGRKSLIRYGDGSRFVDLKLPCGGALDVLIDPNPDLGALQRAKARLDARAPATLVFSSEVDGSAAAKTFRFTYAPRVRLCLAGRGAIFRAMAQVGHATGFEIFLMSPDTEDLAAIGHLARQAPIHLTSLDQPVDMAMLDPHAAFLTLFHDHDWEPGLLLEALKTPVGFIGSLGSRKTHALRCENLLQLGASEEAIGRLRGPIGLVGSLRDASFVAVSALAEIVAAFPSQLVKDRDSEIEMASARTG